MVAEFEASGLHQKEFVAKHALSLGTFQYWLYKKSMRASVRLSESEGNPRAAFLPVDVVASPAPQARAGHLKVALPRRLLRFPLGADTVYLAHLLAALG